MGKTFRVYAAPRFLTFTEDEVRNAKFTDEKDRDDVFALEIGDTHVTRTGVEFTRIEDDVQRFNAIVCVRGGRKPKKCVVCGARGTLLCDFKAAGKTCDKPLCRDHARKIARGIDYCLDHPAEAR